MELEMQFAYTFRIRGNQEDPSGNPIPYQRVTQGSKWTGKARRYERWKEYVRLSFFDSQRGKTSGRWLVNDHKPLTAAEGYTRMDIIIGWKNETHGDCDNIFKGIADALFESDKHLVGSFEFMHTTNREGWVDINIWTSTPTESVVSVARRRHNVPETYRGLKVLR